MKKLLGIILILCAATSAIAQPSARRAAQAQAQQAGQTQKKSASALSTRAQLSLPTAQKMDEDVVWRRDIYREIDLTEGTNAGLYYPVEPVGSQMNLFTYLFKLVLSGQVKAYEYRLDGNESFEKDALVKPLALLDNYHIYYERMDGRLKLDNSDIPSREVKSYYIKESSYYDQNSATFHTKVIALCPIMSREDDFGDGTAKYPLFWVKYDDAAPFLAKQTIMTSDINNAAMMSVDDYFVKNMYKGKIYKTNNMLGQTLAQYCPTDSAMKKEQDRIEAELKAFEENIWGDKARKDSLDSIAKAIEANPKAARKAAKANRRAAAAAGKNADSSVQKKSSNRRRSSATGSSARVSVRRERH
ncbi:MAG: gliding motility protein GldN [Prevotella sp.]|nr:gliding motility protein GldN [Prevotella sp.]